VIDAVVLERWLMFVAWSREREVKRWRERERETRPDWIVRQAATRPLLAAFALLLGVLEECAGRVVEMNNRSHLDDGSQRRQASVRIMGHKGSSMNAKKKKKK
jgi:hypothetical protein